jgi:polyhydroxybutyrate depolymerase
MGIAPSEPGPDRQELRLRTPDGRVRSAIVAIPSSSPDPVGRALVVMLHGAGGSAAGVLDSTRWAQLAQKHNFVVVCPNGTPADEAVPQNFLRNPQTWNSGQGFSLSSGNLSAEAKGIDDEAFIALTIATVSSLTAINPRQVYVCGHSNGACMAYRFAATHPDVVACVGVFAGHLAAGLVRLSSSVSLMCVSGELDPFAPINGGHAGVMGGKGVCVMTRAQRLNAVDWAEANGIPNAPITKRNDSEVAEMIWGPNSVGVEVKWVVVKNHGHSWPGGTSSLPAIVAGPTSVAYDASSAFWTFFSAHPKY